jgi:hypothetical protein
MPQLSGNEPILGLNTGLVQNPNSLTGNRKPSAKNHVPKNHLISCGPRNMSSWKYVGPAEICRLEKKKKIGGAAPKPLHPPRGGLAAPPLTPLRAQHRRSDTNARAKNITHTQHSPTCCFLCTQRVTGLHSQQSRATMPMYPIHQENFSVLTDFVNEFATFFKVSTFISDTFFSSIMSLTK